MGDEMLSSSNSTSAESVSALPETKPPAGSETSPQMPVDPKVLQEQLDQANQRIKRFEDWQQSVADYKTGKSPHDPGDWQPEAEKKTESLPPEPPLISFVGEEMVIESYRQRYPELLPYEDYIALEVATVRDRAARQGKHISQRDAFDEGIRLFQEKLQTHAAKVQHDTRQQARSQTMKQQALQLDAGGSQAKPKTGAEAIWAMSNEEFAKYKEEQLKKAYGL